MTEQLDLADIQGHLLRAYGRFGYPLARYVFLNIRHAGRARRWLQSQLPLVTSAVCWGTGNDQVRPPDCAFNLVLSYQGLKELELPRASLIGFAPEFVEGMKHRRDILGDDGVSAPEHWDPIWQANRSVREADIHIGVLLNARLPEPADTSPAGQYPRQRSCAGDSGRPSGRRRTTA